MPRPAKPAANKTIPNPYLGFGWVGWVGVVVFGVALALMALDIDIFYGLQYLLALHAGPETLIDVTRFYIRARMLYIEVPFGLMVALLFIACLYWADLPPERRDLAARRIFLLGLLTFASQMALMSYSQYRPVGIVQAGPFQIAVEFLVVDLIATFLVSLTIARTTRSAWVGYSTFGIGLLCSILVSWEALYNTLFFSWFVDGMSFSTIVFNFAILMPLLIWIVDRHQNPSPLLHCSECLYDLTNLPSSICPECGEDVSAVVSVASA